MGTGGLQDEDEQFLKGSSGRGGNMFSRKYGAFKAVYVQIFQKKYLDIEPEWFARFVGDELGFVVDCYDEPFFAQIMNM